MLLAAYGTLRPGGVWFKEMQRRYGQLALRPITPFWIDGYEMYTDGILPYVTRGKGRVLVDIIALADEAANAIAALEINAGYYGHMIPILTSKACIFLFDDCKHMARVVTGDWLNPIPKVLTAKA